MLPGSTKHRSLRAIIARPATMAQQHAGGRPSAAAAQHAVATAFGVVSGGAPTSVHSVCCRPPPTAVKDSPRPTTTPASSKPEVGQPKWYGRCTGG